MLSIPQRYRQTDRQTDRRTTYDSNTALALRASRGKNQKLDYCRIAGVLVDKRNMVQTAANRRATPWLSIE